MSATPNTPPTTADLLSARRGLERQLNVLPLAYSLDGRGFTFQAPLDVPLPLGGFVELSTPEGGRYLGQVLSREVQVAEGTEVKIGEQAALNEVVAPLGVTMSEAVVRLFRHVQRGSGELIADLDRPDLRLQVAGGFPEALIAPARPDDLARAIAAWTRNVPGLPVGTMAGTDLPAIIDARGFSRHTFLCGQSGSGKTYSLGVVIEQLLLHTDLRLVLLDPNGDYVHLKTPHATRQGETPSPELAEYLRRVAGMRILRSAPGAATDRLRVRLSDLAPDDEARTLQLDPLADREEFHVFRQVIEAMPGARYDFRDLIDAARADLAAPARSLLLRLGNLGVADWPVWSTDDESSLGDALTTDWRSMVLDISGLTLAAERSVVALAMLRHFWQERERRQPVLVVIDEAHNICPATPGDAIQAAATDLLITIAAEGRKFGIYLLLSTQRPDKLHPQILSQCDNLMLMRMNSRGDLDQLAETFSFVPIDLLYSATGFRPGEALLAGKIVRSPWPVRLGQRLAAEGGADVPTTWARRAE